MDFTTLLKNGEFIKILSLAGTILLILAILILAVNTWLGGKRSREKNLIRLAVNVVSGIIAVFCTPIAVRRLAGDKLANAAAALPADIANNEVLSDILYSMSKALSCIIIFGIFYLVIAVILLIIANVANIGLKKSDPDVFSYIITGVSTLFTLFLLLSPIYAFTYSLAGDVSTIISTKSNNSLVNFVLDAVKEEYEENITPERLEQLGNKRNALNSFVYDRLTVFEYPNGKINVHTAMSELCAASSEVIANAPKDLDVTDFDLTPENVEFLRFVKNCFFKSDFLKVVLTEVTHDSCTAWYNKETYLGYSDPFEDSNYKQNSRKMYEILKDADDEGFDRAFDFAAEKAREDN